MLVLTRRIDEKVVIDGVISVMVVAIRGDKARLGNGGEAIARMI